MRKFGIFVLGMIFGVIFFFAALFGAGWIALEALSPKDIIGNNTNVIDSIGDFKDMSLMAIIKELANVYNTKIGVADANYSIAQFEEDYNFNMSQLIGFEIGDDIKALPVFEVFKEGGVDKLMSAISVPSILAIAAPDMLSDAALEKLSNVYLTDLLNDPISVVSLLNVGDIAMIDGELGAIVNDMPISVLMSGDINTILADVTLRTVLGDDGVNGSMFEAFADMPIMQLTKEINNIMLGGVLGLQTKPVEDITGYTAVTLSGTPTREVMRNIVGNYIMSDIASTTTQPQSMSSADAPTETRVWSEATFACVDKTHDNIHTQSCYKYKWFSDDNGTLVEDTSILAVIATFTIADLQSSENINNVLMTLTLRDVLGDAAVADGIFASFADLSIGELNDEMSTMLIGKFLGLEQQPVEAINAYTDVSIVTDNTNIRVRKTEGTTPLYAMTSNATDTAPDWYNAEFVCATAQHTDDTHTEDCFRYLWYTSEVGGALTPESGIMTVIASLTFEHLQQPDKLNNMIKSVTLRDVLGDAGVSDGIFESLADITIGNLNDELSNIKLGSILSLVLEEVQDISSYTTTIALVGSTVAVRTDGINYVMSDNGDAPWYNAEKCCTDDTHSQDTHTEDCYRYMWYNEGPDGSLTQEKGVTVVIASLTLEQLQQPNKLGDIIQTITLRTVLGDEAVADGILASLADTPIGKIEGEITSVMIGELLNYQKSAVDNIEGYSAIELTDNATATRKVMVNGNTYIMTDIDSSTWYNAELKCTDAAHTQAHTQDCFRYLWYSNEALQTGVTAAIATLTINDLQQSGKLNSVVNSLTLKDVLGADAVSSGILASLADTPIDQMSTKINTLMLGEILDYNKKEVTVISGYTDVTLTGTPSRKVMVNGTTYIMTDINSATWYEAELRCEDSTHGSAEHTQDCFRYLWYSNEALQTGVTAAIATLTIDDLQQSGKLNSVVNSLTLKDVLGADAVSSGILASLADTPIDQMSTKINTLMLGEILDYNKKEVTVISGYTDVTLTGTPSRKVMVNGTTYIMTDINSATWYEAELRCEDSTHGLAEHTQGCFRYLWYSEDTLQTGVTAAIATLTIDDLQQSGKLNSVVNSLTLKDVLGADAVSSGILSSLADTPIDQMSTRMNSIMLGELLSYQKAAVDSIEGYAAIELTDTATATRKVMVDGNTYIMTDIDSSTWYNAELKCTDAAHTQAHTQDCFRYLWYSEDTLQTGVTAAIATLTLTDMQQSGKLNDVIQSLTLADVLGADAVSSGILASLADTKISEIGTKIDNLALGEVMGYVRRPSTTVDYNTTVIDGTVMSDGNGNYTKIDGNTWYDAKLQCSDTASHNTTNIHTAECYKYMYFSRTCSHTDDSQHTASDTACYGSNTGVLGAISGLAINQLGGDTFQNAIDDLVLGDIITIDDSASPLIKELSNKKIGEMASTIDNTYVGIIQGKYRNEISDTAGYTAVVDGIMSKGDSYIKQDNDTWYLCQLDCTVDHTHTADCYTFAWYDDIAMQNKSNKLDTMVSNLTISSMAQGDAITNIVASLTIGDMLEGGIITISLENQNTLDRLFSMKATDWRDLGVTQFIDEILSIISSAIPQVPVS